MAGREEGRERKTLKELEEQFTGVWAEMFLALGTYKEHWNQSEMLFYGHCEAVSVFWCLITLTDCSSHHWPKWSGVWGRGYFKAGKQRGGTTGVKHVIDLLAGQVRQVVRLISHWADIKRGLQVSLCSLKQQSHGRIRSQLFQQNLMITFFFLKSVLLIKPLKQ